jgi:hypothetical protein
MALVLGIAACGGAGAGDAPADAGWPDGAPARCDNGLWCDRVYDDECSYDVTHLEERDKHILWPTGCAWAGGCWDDLDCDVPTKDWPCYVPTCEGSVCTTSASGGHECSRAGVCVAQLGPNGSASPRAFGTCTDGILTE